MKSILHSARAVVLCLFLVPTVCLADPCSDHDAFRDALRAASNAAIGDLLDAGNWTVYDDCPRISRTGFGALRFFSAATGTGIPFNVAIEEPTERVRDTLTMFTAALGVYSDRSQFIYTRKTESLGNIYYRFGQLYDGYRVWGAEGIVQTDGDTTYAQSITSDYMRDTYELDCFPEALTALLTEEQAQTIARELLEPKLEARIAEQLAGIEALVASGDMTEERADEIRAAYAETILVNGDDPVDVIIYAPEVLGVSGPPRLAYRTDVFSTPTQLISYQVFVDARTGEELQSTSYTRHKKRDGESPGTKHSSSTHLRAELSPFAYEAQGAKNASYSLLTEVIGEQLTALGDRAAAELINELAHTSLSQGADYADLFLGLQNAAANLYNAETSPTLETALSVIDKAAAAEGIASHDKLAASKCGLPEPEIRTDIDGDGVTDSVDIQRSINAVLGTGSTDSADVNDDGTIDAVDIQIVINTVLGVE